MNNKEQSAGTIAGQSTEAEVINVSHNNGNTHVGCSLSLSENASVGEKKKFISAFGVNIVNKETDEFFNGLPNVLSKQERDKISEILYKDLSEEEHLWLRNIVSKLNSAGLKIKTYGLYFMSAHQQPALSS